MRHLLAMGALLASPVGPALAQDTWSNYAVMTGQSAVLDEMNRENARRLHREKGLPAPDFKGAGQRLADRERSRATTPGSGRMTPERKAHNCAVVRAQIHKVPRNQLAQISRFCGWR